MHLRADSAFFGAYGTAIASWILARSPKYAGSIGVFTHMSLSGQSSIVFSFPAQEHAGGDSKIPSVLLYDKQGNVRAAGAETLQEDIMEIAFEEGWFKSEWYVLRFLSV